MYDVIIVGAGPGGIFTAYELAERKPGLKIAVFEMGHELKKRKKKRYPTFSSSDTSILKIPAISFT